MLPQNKIREIKNKFFLWRCCCSSKKKKSALLYFSWAKKVSFIFIFCFKRWRWWRHIFSRPACGRARVQPGSTVHGVACKLPCWVDPALFSVQIWTQNVSGTDEFSSILFCVRNFMGTLFLKPNLPSFWATVVNPNYCTKMFGDLTARFGIGF